MKRIKAFFSNIYLSVIILPYIFLVKESVVLESYFGIVFFWFSIVLLDVFLTIKKIDKKLLVLTLTFFAYLFYGWLFYQDYAIDFSWFKFRYFSVLFIILCYIIFHLITKNNSPKRKLFLNVVIINFCLINFISSSIEFNPLFDSSKIKFDSFPKKSKEIVLIVLDAYSSSDELYKISKDSTLYEFEKKLNNNGWITKRNFFSHELVTSLSISSLLNYNLSKSNNFTISNVLNKKFMIKNKLIEDLILKDYKVRNYGLIDFENIRSFARSETHSLDLRYIFPIDNFYFLSRFLSSSSLYYVNDIVKRIKEKNNTKIIKKSKSLEDLQTRLGKGLFSKNTFSYYHILIPHFPFVYEDFPFKEKTTINYINYWKFINSKISKIIFNNPDLKNYRIIITGDHGYRADDEINPYISFGAFYGFEKDDVENIKTVQDLGSLIIHYSN